MRKAALFLTAIVWLALLALLARADDYDVPNILPPPEPAARLYRFSAFSRRNLGPRRSPATFVTERAGVAPRRARTFARAMLRVGVASSVSVAFGPARSFTPFGPGSWLVPSAVVVIVVVASCGGVVVPSAR